MCYYYPPWDVPVLLTGHHSTLCLAWGNLVGKMEKTLQACSYTADKPEEMNIRFILFTWLKIVHESKKLGRPFSSERSYFFSPLIICIDTGTESFPSHRLSGSSRITNNPKLHFNTNPKPQKSDLQISVSIYLEN